MLTLRILLVGLLMACVQGAPTNTGPAETAKAICANQASGPITSPSQLAEIAGHIKDIECPQHIKEAMTDLNKLISNHKDNVCNLDHVNQIREFYASHVADEMVEHQPPKALKDLFLSYAMRVSEGCKKSMLLVLLGPASEALAERDYLSFETATPQFDALLQSITEPGFILIPSDLATILPHNMQKKLVVDAKFAGHIAALKEVCTKRFQPIYEPLVRPISELTRAGFDYPDTVVRDELKLSKEDEKHLRVWTRVVFLCETLLAVDPVKHEEGKPTDTLRVAGGNVTNELVHEDSTLEPIKYASNTKVGLSEIVPISQEQLEELIRNLLDNNTPIDRFREKLRQNAIKISNAYANGEDLQSILSCFASHPDPTKEVSSEESSETAITAERQVCGAPKSFGSALQQIFFAIILAAILCFAIG